MIDCNVEEIKFFPDSHSFLKGLNWPVCSVAIYLFIFLFMFETSLQFHKKLTFSLANQIVALYKFCVKLIWDGLWISLESLTSFLLLFSNTKPDTFPFSRWMTILQKEVQNIQSAKVAIFDYLKSQKQNALSLGT